jgi:hypothetical protein
MAARICGMLGRPPRGYYGVIMEAPQEDYEGEGAPEDDEQEPGAEGGSGSPAKDQLPGAPSDDDSALGDTDQHSDA